MNTCKTRNLLNTTLSAYVTLAGSARRFQSHTENNVFSSPLKGCNSLPKSKIKLRSYTENGNIICVEGKI